MRHWMLAVMSEENSLWRDFSLSTLSLSKPRPCQLMYLFGIVRGTRILTGIGRSPNFLG